MNQINIVMLKMLLILLIAFSGFKQNSNSSQKKFFINNQDDFNRYSGFFFPEGSSVLFAKGVTFSGQFILKGSGTVEEPNLLCAYDSVSGLKYTDWLDIKPKINGEGRVKAVILLDNGSNWEINNIEVTNNNGTTDNHGDIMGIHVVAKDNGIVENITIKNCYVHHVNGHVGGKNTGGIHVNVLGNKNKTRFNNLLIENNYVRYVGGVGISNQSSWGNISTRDYFPWTNFTIRKNLVEQTGRNGIIVRYAKNPLVEYNTLAYNSRYDSGHSIFNFNTIDCIVQYNEAYGNTSDDPNEIDHGGFDADYNSTGTIIQYNYSHDNNWFCGIMRKGINANVIIRYNISKNEKIGLFLYGFPTSKGLKNVMINNNTFYSEKGKARKVFVQGGKIRIPIETTFINNIFYFEDEAIWGIEPDKSCFFSNNIFFNLSAKGVKAITEHPQLVDPGKVKTNIDWSNRNKFLGYKPKFNSPAKNAGKALEINNNKDFVGKKIEGIPSIGAIQ